MGGVFQNDAVAVHVIQPSRGVVAEILAGRRPTVCVSDLYGAQRGHAERWQICLTHQLRDCQFAIDTGDALFTPPLKRLRRGRFATPRLKTCPPQRLPR